MVNAEVFHDMTPKSKEELTSTPVIQMVNVNVWRGQQSPKRHVLKDLSISIGSGITAIIGPSGSGKTTALRCINRMMEEEKGAAIKGQVFYDGEDIYGFGLDPVKLRGKIGMVFQKPSPFPIMSVMENVTAGLSLNMSPFLRGKKKEEIEQRGIDTLKKVGLWEEVKNRLKSSGAFLSGGQQQRLCIARALMIDPKVLLMDEPCSALDPLSTLLIEDFLKEIVKEMPIIIVTHKMEQAGRISDRTAFLNAGELVEYGLTKEIFLRPKDQRTKDFIAGRFG